MVIPFNEVNFLNFKNTYQYCPDYLSETKRLSNFLIFCEKCSQKCRVCEQDNLSQDCIECSSNLMSVKNQCACLSGYYYFNQNFEENQNAILKYDDYYDYRMNTQSCQKCHETCAKCSGFYDCDQCLLQQNKQTDWCLQIIHDEKLNAEQYKVETVKDQNHDIKFENGENWILFTLIIISILIFGLIGIFIILKKNNNYEKKCELEMVCNDEQNSQPIQIQKPQFHKIDKFQNSKLKNQIKKNQRQKKMKQRNIKYLDSDQENEQNFSELNETDDCKQSALQIEQNKKTNFFDLIY